MWCTRTQKPSAMVATVRERHWRVADQGPAAEGRRAVGDHAHRRQHDGVDPRVAEQPEQMLPEQGLAGWASKKWVPNWRSIHSRKKARLTAGTASRLATEAVSVPQIRIGTRLTDMPGAAAAGR